jgi:hypothetical protein
MSREDWPASSYVGAMMDDLRRKGIAPEPASQETPDPEPELTDEEIEANRQNARLTQRQRELIAFREGRSTRPPRYASWESLDAAARRLRRRGLLR